MDLLPEHIQDVLINLLNSIPIPLTPLLRIATTIRSLFLPLLTRLATSPDLASIGLLILVLFVSMKLLNMLRRAVVFWIVLAFRVVFWGSLGLAGLYVYNRGLEGTVEDVSTWWGIFWGEYDYWQERARVAEGNAAMRQGGYGRGAYERRTYNTGRTGWR